MNMKRWSKRAPEEANLFNPAFCATILAKAADEYTKKANRPFPYSLSFLVLPIVLHHGTRMALPSTTITALLPWIQEHREPLVNFPLRVQRMLGVTKEAIVFALQHQILMLSSNGDIGIGAKRQSPTDKRTSEFTSEAREWVDRAGFFGRRWAAAGTT